MRIGPARAETRETETSGGAATAASAWPARRGQISLCSACANQASSVRKRFLRRGACKSAAIHIA